MVEGILVISCQDYTKQQIIKYPGKLLIPYQPFLFQAGAGSFLPTEFSLQPTGLFSNDS